MFKELARYKKILVSGPQRSGTRIAAVMIAHDTGHYFVDERVFYHDSIDAFCHLLYDLDKQKYPMVVQCPGMSRWLHSLPRLDEILVVWMVRDIVDVLGSQKRIGWANEPIEKMKYPSGFNSHIAVSKNNFWLIQCLDIPNHKELEYDSLSEHPLWIPKDERKDFKSNQVSRDFEPLPIKVLRSV